MDSSKLAKTSLIDALNGVIDIVITDSNIPDKYKEDLSTKTKLIIV